MNIHHVDWNQLPWEKVREGVERKAFSGEGATVSLNRLMPGHTPRPHDHPHEQTPVVHTVAAQRLSENELPSDEIISHWAWIAKRSYSEWNAKDVSALRGGIASIPAMVEEIGGLRTDYEQQMHRALLAESHLKDSVAAGESYVAENQSLRALNAELHEALTDALHCVGLCSSADEFPEIEKARAILAKSESCEPCRSADVMAHGKHDGAEAQT